MGAAPEALVESGFAESFEPFTGEALGSDDQSRTVPVALDRLAAGDPASGGPILDTGTKKPRPLGRGEPRGGEAAG